MSGVVIIGAGHAGVQAASALRDEGYADDVALIDGQTALPYQRPPLSKAFLKGDASADSIVLRGAAFYSEKRIELMLGSPVQGIDRAAQRVTLGSGAALAYEHLILALGARARPLPVPGADLRGVHVLRDLADAEALRDETAQARNIVVIGAGFIGLEYAAVAAKAGHAVTVIETQPRVMARALSPVMSEAFGRMHRALGVKLLLNTGVAALHSAAGRVDSVETSAGEHLAADLVLVGIGILAEDRLARAAGLATDNGIVVDALMRTSDPAILAVGDGTLHPNPFFGGMMRLESVQNAVDQAKCAARMIMGRPTPYHAVPWFWSDQAAWKLQIAGVAPALDQVVLRGDAMSEAFSVFGFSGGRLAVVESVNRPGDHMAARRIIGEGRSLAPAEAADTGFDLKTALVR